METFKLWEDSSVSLEDEFGIITIWSLSRTNKWNDKFECEIKIDMTCFLVGTATITNQVVLSLDTKTGRVYLNDNEKTLIL